MKLINQNEARNRLGINGKKATHKFIKDLIAGEILPEPKKIAGQLVWLDSDIDNAIREIMSKD